MIPAFPFLAAKKEGIQGARPELHSECRPARTLGTLLLGHLARFGKPKERLGSPAPIPKQLPRAGSCPLGRGAAKSLREGREKDGMGSKRPEGQELLPGIKLGKAPWMAKAGGSDPRDPTSSFHNGSFMGALRKAVELLQAHPSSRLRNSIPERRKPLGDAGNRCGSGSSRKGPWRPCASMAGPPSWMQCSMGNVVRHPAGRNIPRSQCLKATQSNGISQSVPPPAPIPAIPDAFPSFPNHLLRAPERLGPRWPIPDSRLRANPVGNKASPALRAYSWGIKRDLRGSAASFPRLIPLGKLLWLALAFSRLPTAGPQMGQERKGNSTLELLCGSWDGGGRKRQGVQELSALKGGGLGCSPAPKVGMASGKEVGMAAGIMECSSLGTPLSPWTPGIIQLGKALGEHQVPWGLPRPPLGAKALAPWVYPG